MKLRSGFVQIHPPLPSRWRPFLRGALAVLLALLAIVAALMVLCWQVLTPQPAEWSQAWSAGPLRGRVSMPTAIRLATHPMGLRLLDGRILHTGGGDVALRLDADGRTLHAICSPCELRLSALGSRPLRVQRAMWTITRRMPDDFTGSVQLDDPGQGAAMLRAGWRAKVVAGGLQFEMSLPATPVRDYYRVLAADLPELRRARIEGTAAFELQAELPAGRWQLRPQVTGLAVDGLGTEALRGARFDTACPLPAMPEGSDGDEAALLAGFGRWLPRAVIAAEDQRFHEHAGYDLEEMQHAWSANQTARGEQAPTGASTLSQQLAKLMFTGDERSWRRKLRELLWAVELDRTLGKARVLQAYLSLAPWGEGQCGAQAAARHYLNKNAVSLTPMEAAWLAGMLRSPDAQARQWRIAQRVDNPRIARIVDDMRPMPRAERARLVAQAQEWRPQPRVVVGRAGRAGQLAQGEGARRKGAQGGRAMLLARASSGAAMGPSREGVQPAGERSRLHGSAVEDERGRAPVRSQAGSNPAGDRLTYASGEGRHPDHFTREAQVVPR
ncbi:MAG: glycosyl transferase [Aquabacterium sp.]|nr:MAG: glycosyl transferase [Aquabacterium sp.]